MKKPTVFLCSMLLVLFSTLSAVEAATFDVDLNDWYSSGFLVSSDGKVAISSESAGYDYSGSGISSDGSWLSRDYELDSDFLGRIPTRIAFDFAYTLELEVSYDYGGTSLSITVDGDPYNFKTIWFREESDIGNFSYDLTQLYDDFTGVPASSIQFDFNVGLVRNVPSSDLPNASSALCISNVKLDLVPIPGAVWLFGSGLIGLVGIRSKLRQ